ncbi:MAG: hypothetical protein JO129_01970, partial [Candidatus Dependentiae bacterium]|nr:hypothetical protein [Candidatus Dependentiae bacterium]
KISSEIVNSDHSVSVTKYKNNQPVERTTYKNRSDLNNKLSKSITTINYNADGSFEEITPLDTNGSQVDRFNSLGRRISSEVPNKDGSSIKTEYNPDSSSVVTQIAKDGSKQIIETNQFGNIKVTKNLDKEEDGGIQKQTTEFTIIPMNEGVDYSQLTANNQFIISENTIIKNNKNIITKVIGDKQGRKQEIINYKEGKPVSGNIIYADNTTGEIAFDQDGLRIITKVNNKDRSSTKSFMNSSNDIARVEEFDSKGTLISTSTYSYNDKGQVESVIKRDSDGQLISKSEYSYKANGDLEITVYDKNDIVIKKTVNGVSDTKMLYGANAITKVVFEQLAHNGIYLDSINLQKITDLIHSIKDGKQINQQDLQNLPASITQETLDSINNIDISQGIAKNWTIQASEQPLIEEKQQIKIYQSGPALEQAVFAKIDEARATIKKSIADQITNQFKLKEPELRNKFQSKFIIFKSAKDFKAKEDAYIAFELENDIQSAYRYYQAKIDQFVQKSVNDLRAQAKVQESTAKEQTPNQAKSQKSSKVNLNSIRANAQKKQQALIDQENAPLIESQKNDWMLEYLYNNKFKYPTLKEIAAQESKIKKQIYQQEPNKTAIKNAGDDAVSAMQNRSVLPESSASPVSPALSAMPESSESSVRPVSPLGFLGGIQGGAQKLKKASK